MKYRESLPCRGLQIAPEDWSADNAATEQKGQKRPITNS